MKKLKNCCHFINIDHTEKFQITDPPPKVRVSSFQGVKRNGISVSAIVKKLKNGCHFININHMENFQITDLLKFGSPVFRVSMETEYQCWPLWKNWKFSFFWIFHQFIFPPSPILGSISTFMRGYTWNIYAWTFMRDLPHESPMCSFTLPDIILNCNTSGPTETSKDMGGIKQTYITFGSFARRLQNSIVKIIS